MKSLFILGALLLSASPVVAGDFVCLRCDAKAQVRAIDAETVKVIRDFLEIETMGEDNVFKEIYKIDIKNSQYTCRHYGSQKRDVQVNVDAEIKNGKLMHFGEGLRVCLEVKISFDSPGESLKNGSYVGFALEGMYVGGSIGKGVCWEIDASAFEESLNESES